MDDPVVYRAPYRGAGRPASCLHLYGLVDTYPLREEGSSHAPDTSTADFWYLCDGKIETFNCYVMFSIMFAQMSVMPDFASAVAAPVAAR